MAFSLVVCYTLTTGHILMYRNEVHGMNFSPCSCSQPSVLVSRKPCTYFLHIMKECVKLRALPQIFCSL